MLAPARPDRRHGGRHRLAWLVTVALLAVFARGPAVAADDLRLLVFGDSLVAGYNLPQGQGYPGQLEKALAERGRDVEVINAGVSGDTTAGGKRRLSWALQDDPDAAIVVLGGNDALRGLDPKRAKQNLAAIIEGFQAEGVAVMLAGMKAPPNMGESYSQAFNSIYPELAKRYDTVFYPFFLKGVAGKPALNQGDGIHPTAEGVQVIVENSLPAVERLLARARADEPDS